MKKSILLVATVLIFMACTEPETNPVPENTIENKDLKGQSSVSDDSSEKNVLQVALGSKDHTTLVAAVQAAGLEDVLVNAGPLTVFAPTNAAFDALPAGTVEDLLKPENKSKLAKIIKFHASPGNYQGDLLKDGQRLYQASGDYVQVSKENNEILVHGAKIIATVQASNGVVHVVDKVMLP
ncbi:MAG: fasciclin domain-containing protein [Saprospiraceae bacterium]|nr:fasciclin domain-containing protein [Saprospiraceae bacterium]